MILRQLTLVNFKKYKNKTFPFEEGLTGIIGKNGSGKSTIFDGILFALFGELKAKGYKETIRNAQAEEKDPVGAELEFEFDGAQYTVKREFRGKALSANAQFSKNGVETASGAKEVTNEVIRLTKMSKDAFLHTLFASQKELTSLSSMKNEDRKKMIRKLLGLEKIDFIEKLIVERRRELKSVIDSYREILLSDEKKKELEEELKDLNGQKKNTLAEKEKREKELAELTKKSEEDKKALELLQKTKEAKQKILNEIELLNQSQQSNGEAKKKLENELKDLENRAKDLKTKEPVKKEYSELIDAIKKQNELKNIAIKKEALEKEQAELRDLFKQEKAKIELLQKECGDYDKILEGINETSQKLEAYKKDLTTAEKKEKEILEQISGENRVIKDTKEKVSNLQKLGRDGNCPTCTRPLLEEYDNVIISLNQTVERIQKEKLTLLNTAYKENSKKIAEIKKDKDSFEAALKKDEGRKALIESKQKDLKTAQNYFEQVAAKGKANKEELEKLKNHSYDKNHHEALEKKEQELKPKYEAILKLEESIKRADTVKKDLENATAKEEKMAKDLTAKTKENQSVVYDEKAHQEIQRKSDELQKTKELKTAEHSGTKEKIAELNGKIENINKEVERDKEQQKLLTTKKEDLKDYEKIKANLTDFKTKLNSKIAPRISDIASTMYSQITKGKYQHIEVNNDFDFFIYDDGVKYQIERFSGGEIDLANLVLRIAISKTLGELNGTSGIGFLAFDEVFGSQDESRRMEILEAFHTIKEQYRQIFLISHEMEIKEMLERVVEV